MTTEIYKRVELLREIEMFEEIHHTVLRDFRREQKFPIPHNGREGIIDRIGILRRIFK